MDSLHPPCTPLKKKYDACFNHWFDEYLQLAAPTTSTSTSSSSNGQQQKLDTDSIASERSKDDRQTKIKSKAAEYEQRCGETWKAYRNCLEAGLKEKELTNLIREAREEFPLKAPKEIDMTAPE